MRKILRIGLILFAVVSLPGCAAVALTAGGVAGSAGVNHTLGGIVYKTFNAPVKDVRQAAIRSLGDMEIKVNQDEVADFGWQIFAEAYKRTIDIRLERLTPSTTRMRVVTSENAFIKDAATSTEIILQTSRWVESAHAQVR